MIELLIIKVNYFYNIGIYLKNNSDNYFFDWVKCNCFWQDIISILNWGGAAPRVPHLLTLGLLQSGLLHPDTCCTTAWLHLWLLAAACSRMPCSTTCSCCHFLPEAAWQVAPVPLLSHTTGQHTTHPPAVAGGTGAMSQERSGWSSWRRSRAAVQLLLGFGRPGYGAPKVSG